MQHCCSLIDLELCLYSLNLTGVLFNFLALISFGINDLTVSLGLLVIVIVGERVAQVLFYLYSENQLAFADNPADKNKELFMRIFYLDGYLHINDRQKVRQSKPEDSLAQQKRRKVALKVQQIFGSIGSCGGLFIESHGLILSHKSEPILCICIAVHLISLAIANTTIYLNDNYKNITFKLLILKNFLNLLAFFGFWSLCSDIQRPQFIAPHLVAAGILLLILFVLFREKDQKKEEAVMRVVSQQQQQKTAVQIIPKSNADQLDKLIIKEDKDKRNSQKNQVKQLPTISNLLSKNNVHLEIDHSQEHLTEKRDPNIDNQITPNQTVFLQDVVDKNIMNNNNNNMHIIRQLQEQEQDFVIGSQDAASDLRVMQMQLGQQIEDKTSHINQDEKEEVIDQKDIQLDDSQEEEQQEQQANSITIKNIEKQTNHQHEIDNENIQNNSNKSASNEISVKNIFKQPELNIKSERQGIVLPEDISVNRNFQEYPIITTIRNPSPTQECKSERTPSLLKPQPIKLEAGNNIGKESDQVEILSEEDFDFVPGIQTKKKSQLDILADDCILAIKFIICGLFLNHNYTNRILFDSESDNNNNNIQDKLSNDNGNNKQIIDTNNLTKPVSAFKAANILFLFIFDIAFNEFKEFSGLRVLAIIAGFCYLVNEIVFLVEFDPRQSFCYDFVMKEMQKRQQATPRATTGLP